MKFGKFRIEIFRPFKKTLLFHLPVLCSCKISFKIYLIVLYFVGFCSQIPFNLFTVFPDSQDHWVFLNVFKFSLTIFNSIFPETLIIWAINILQYSKSIFGIIFKMSNKLLSINPTQESKPFHLTINPLPLINSSIGPFKFSISIRFIIFPHSKIFGTIFPFLRTMSILINYILTRIRTPVWAKKFSWCTICIIFIYYILGLLPLWIIFFKNFIINKQILSNYIIFLLLKFINEGLIKIRWLLIILLLITGRKFHCIGSCFLEW